MHDLVGPSSPNMVNPVRTRLIIHQHMRICHANNAGSGLVLGQMGWRVALVRKLSNRSTSLSIFLEHLFRGQGQR